MVPPLPEQPQPNISMTQSTPNVMQTGLTPVETAFIIRRREDDNS